MTLKVYSHGYEQFFSWTTLSTYGLYDAKNDRIFPSFDLNTSLLLINGGIDYKNISYIDAKKLSAYVGLGIGSLIQLQAGISKDGFSLRNRYDMQLGLFEKIGLKYPFFGYTTVSLSVQRYFNNPEMKWFLGVGIGFSISNFRGFNLF
jgi:hypothetical protein